MITSKGALRIVGSPATLSDVGRAKHDFYATPPSATRAFFETIKFDELDIWEPACGDGAICKVAGQYGYRPIGTDLIDRGYGIHGVDFLRCHTLYAPQIVTNPPFNLARQFVEHSLDLGVRKAAFLLRLQFLEGQRRRKMFESTPLSKVMVFSKRIPRMHNPEFTGKKTTSLIAFAWFYWDVEHKGSPNINWIEPIGE